MRVHSFKSISTVRIVEVEDPSPLGRHEYRFKGSGSAHLPTGPNLNYVTIGVKGRP
jgi:hypothetical protein